MKRYLCKRYLAFSGDEYYPGGGWSDFKGEFDSLDDAIAAVKGAEWWHVVDLHTSRIVSEGEWD